MSEARKTHLTKKVIDNLNWAIQAWEKGEITAEKLIEVLTEAQVDVAAI